MNNDIDQPVTSNVKKRISRWFHSSFISAVTWIYSVSFWQWIPIADFECTKVKLKRERKTSFLPRRGREKRVAVNLRAGFWSSQEQKGKKKVSWGRQTRQIEGKMECRRRVRRSLYICRMSFQFFVWWSCKPNACKYRFMFRFKYRLYFHSSSCMIGPFSESVYLTVKLWLRRGQSGCTATGQLNAIRLNVAEQSNPSGWLFIPWSSVFKCL